MTLLTAAEYQQAPTAVDTGNLVAGGDANTQAAELANVLARADAWIRTFINQAIVAETSTVTRRVRCNRYGEIVIHPDNMLGSPTLTALLIGPASAGTTGLASVSSAALAAAYLDREQFIIPVTPPPGVQLGDIPAGEKFLARYTYTAGYVATALTSAPSPGATSFTIANATAVAAGPFRIFDGANTETVTVASVNGSTVTLSAPTAYAHTVGAGFSNAPADVKQAAIYVTTSLIKGRAADTLTMSTTTAAGPQGGPDPVASQDLRAAREILYNYCRVR